MHYYLSTRLRHTVAGALRGLLRLVWFSSVFVACATISVSARALLPVPRHRRRAAAIRRWLGRRLTRAAGVRITRVGRRPRTGLIVSNHLSWLDSFVLLGETGARFVANSVWGAIPALRTVLRASGVLFIERTRLRDAREVGASLGRILRRGEAAVVFPEATTGRGDQIMPFRGALLQPSVSASLPVRWLALRYQTPPGWPPAGVVVSWVDWTPLLLHMYRAFYPRRISARIVYGECPVIAASRKELAATLRNLVSAAFDPQEQLDPADLARIAVPPPGPQPKY